MPNRCTTAVRQNGEIQPIAADHKNQNLKLMPYIEKQVKVTGTSLEKGGVQGIAIKTVEAAE